MIEEDVSSGGVTTVTRYVQDGWNPDKPAAVGNEDFDQPMTLDGSNNLVTRYLNGDGVDQAFARITVSGGAGAWYWTDQLGNTRFLTDNSGNVLNQITYTGFGGVVTQTHAAYSDQHMFAGMIQDSASGYGQTVGREYDSSSGTWRSADPLGLGAGNPNLYEFVWNNPTHFVDPSGLLPTRTQKPLAPPPQFDPNRPQLGPAPKAPTFWDYLGEALKGANEGSALDVDRLTLGLIPSAHKRAEQIRDENKDSGLYRGADAAAAVQAEAIHWILLEGAAKAIEWGVKALSGGGKAAKAAAELGQAERTAPKGAKTVEDFLPEAQRRLEATKAKYPGMENVEGMAHKNAGKTVGEILKGKKGSIKGAALEAGSPSWSEIGSMTWEDIVAKAEADVPGFRTIKKLLGDKRFDK